MPSRKEDMRYFSPEGGHLSQEMHATNIFPTAAENIKKTRRQMRLDAQEEEERRHLVVAIEKEGSRKFLSLTRVFFAGR